MQVGQNLPADGPHVRPENRHVRQEVPDDPREVNHVPQEPRHFCREKKTGENTMKPLTWNVCRLLAGGQGLGPSQHPHVLRRRRRHHHGVRDSGGVRGG
jgi:hypothetical protein